MKPRTKATFLRPREQHCLLQVLRARLEFPELLAKVIAQRAAFGRGPVLIDEPEPVTRAPVFGLELLALLQPLQPLALEA